MNHPPQHAESLGADLNRLMAMAPQRRRLLAWLAAGGAAQLGLVGCGGGGDAAAAATGTSSDTTGSTGNTGSASGTCAATPDETAGPYPGDGTNSNGSGIANALVLSGIVRGDIRSSIGGASGTAAGVPLTVNLTLVNANGLCGSLAGYAVYLWHCTADGRYSMYSSGVTDQNFLRGVQVSDAQGQVTFNTIFPGCYSGRWPHIHFEVYPSLAVATAGSNDVKTSQLALPASACHQVYGVASGYDASVANFAGMSLASDNVFGNDSAVQQLATVTGSASTGMVANLTVGVAA